MSKKISVELDLRKLSDAERLWYCRKLIGWNQYQMAKDQGVSHNVYCDTELGRRPLADGLRAHVDKQRLPAMNVGWRLLLARRRKAMPLATAARRAGFSRVGYLALERAGDARLVRFWMGLGFVF